VKHSWIDISVPLRSGMVHWPGDPAVAIERRLELERGEVMNLSAVSMSLHSGTHMDAPLHFLREGASLDEMPLEATVGPARVIEIRDPESIRPEHLAGRRIRRGERILFKTRNSRRCWWCEEFLEDFVHISKEAAQWLAQRRVRTLGIDYISVGGYHRDTVETHQILLGAGIWVIEGLNLAGVRAGRYELVCLPLRVLRSDGAPARAILRR
jgi:arylformamidase